MAACWRDRDAPELARARALLAVEKVRDDDLVDLIDLLNEPLPVLPCLAAEVLARRADIVVAADLAWQRLRACRHDPASHVADDATAATGRATCVDCDAVVVPFARVAALASGLEGCALFRGLPLPTSPPWIVVDHRRIERRARPIRVGAGPSDDVVVAGLPAGGVSLLPGDDVVDVRCADGLRVVATPRCGGDLAVASLRSLARSHIVAPSTTELHVFREREPHRPGIAFLVDLADAWAIDVRWPAFGARSTLRVGAIEPLSFDGTLRALRTAEGVVVVVGGRTPDVIALEVGTRVELPLGEATALWSGRALEVRGCPPPPSRAPAVNLLVNQVVARRP